MVMVADGNGMRTDVLKHMDEIASLTKADVFLLHPRQIEADTASLHGSLETSAEGKLRMVVYGDMECCEHAKTRLLIMIDQIVCNTLRCRDMLLTLYSSSARSTRSS